MLKYAFIMNIPGESPESYCGIYKNQKSESMVVGTDGMEETKKLVKSLSRKGYTLFDLCGDFDEEMTKEVEAAAEGNVQVSNATYFGEQLSAIEKLPSMSEYGVIVHMDGVNETEEVIIKSSECNSYTKFVKDLEGAKEAAKELVNQGIYFIELCGWFDKNKTEEIIKAINNKVPIGTCGV